MGSGTIWTLFPKADAAVTNLQLKILSPNIRQISVNAQKLQNDILLQGLLTLKDSSQQDSVGPENEH